MAIRHIEQPESAFKVAYKTLKLRKSKFRSNGNQEFLEKACFEEDFLLSFNYVNNNKPDKAKKKIS